MMWVGGRVPLNQHLVHCGFASVLISFYPKLKLKMSEKQPQGYCV